MNPITMTIAEIMMALSPEFVHGADVADKKPEQPPAIESQQDEHFQYKFEPVRTIICDTRTGQATIIEYLNGGYQNVTRSTCGRAI